MRWLALLLPLLLAVVPATAQDSVRVASKTFTESVLLGEMLQQLANESGDQCVHRSQLGGTRLLWNALLSGDLDAYPEYTGTIQFEILAEQQIAGDAALRAAVEQQGIRMTAPLGFNNTYALGMLKSTAEQRGITQATDLVQHPDLKLGFSNEFMDRGDGWPALQARYALPHRQVRGLDHDIAYRALQSGDIDVIDLYSTDAEIRYYDLAVLADDLAHFPRYDAVIVYRADLEQRYPQVVAAWKQLEGSITAEAMIALNAAAKLDKRPEPEVAAQFLEREFSVENNVVVETLPARLYRLTMEHLFLVLASLLPAILVGVPLGIVAAHRPALSQPILATVGLIQTIPALALLVLLMVPLARLNLPAIGSPPAISALFLYSLLPIVRNTFTGIREMPTHLRESATALGLTPMAQLQRIELPLASRMILAGIKTACVINIGFATLGALIGAGGYGQPIMTGIRLDDHAKILEGALPAAGLALVAQFLFEYAERWLVPRGMRIASTH